jgi:hypothetical protein
VYFTQMQQQTESQRWLSKPTKLAHFNFFSPPNSKFK